MELGVIDLMHIIFFLEYINCHTGLNYKKRCRQCFLVRFSKSRFVEIKSISVGTCIRFSAQNPICDQNAESSPIVCRFPYAGNKAPDFKWSTPENTTSCTQSGININCSSTSKRKMTCQSAREITKRVQITNLVANLYNSSVRERKIH